VLLSELLPQLDGLAVEDVTVCSQNIILMVASTAPTAACHRCGRDSDRVHSRYTRTLRDLAIGPHTVTLQVQVRRFRCRNRACPQATFAERFPKLGAVRARRTYGQQAALEEVGLALGGAAGARLAKRVRLPASRSTILRLVHAATGPSPPTPRVLGVDDWARRRGQTYGTILVDLERHCPVELLPDRTAETLAQWLIEHPGVEVIARDRAGAYAQGARQGAPNAVQVADRFHLLMNVGQALERVLNGKRGCLKTAAAAVERLAVESSQARVADSTSLIAPTLLEQATQYERLKQARRAHRLERYETVVVLHEQGLSLREIGRRLSISNHTVTRFIGAGQFPERAQTPPKPTLLTPYEPYLRERWSVGCHNARLLWVEIRGQGFTGSASLVRRFLARWRPSPGRRGPTPRRVAGAATSPTPPVREPTRVLSPRQARWLLLRDVNDLQPEERVYREHLLAADEELGHVRGLTEGFGRIVRSRDCPSLMAWLREAENSGSAEFRQFALALRRDLAAVEAALTYGWSSGQTEGQINRLKMLKRQMYGRASLRLLGRRFLTAA
jgi:transposase